jgi:hypothetical protein
MAGASEWKYIVRRSKVAARMLPRFGLSVCGRLTAASLWMHVVSMFALVRLTAKRDVICAVRMNSASGMILEFRKSCHVAMGRAISAGDDNGMANVVVIRLCTIKGIARRNNEMFVVSGRLSGVLKSSWNPDGEMIQDHLNLR